MEEFEKYQQIKHFLDSLPLLHEDRYKISLHPWDVYITKRGITYEIWWYKGNLGCGVGRSYVYTLVGLNIFLCLLCIDLVEWPQQ